MRFYPLEKMINLHDDYTRKFRIDSLSLLLMQRQGERFLIEATCPHQGHPLEVASVDSGVIQCARHHYRFSIDDGRLLYASEEGCRNLRVFEPVYEGNEVGIMLAELSD